MVQRYRPDSDEQERSFEMIPDDGGDYVAHGDYEELEAENRRLRDALDRIESMATIENTEIQKIAREALKEASHE